MYRELAIKGFGQNALPTELNSIAGIGGFEPTTALISISNLHHCTNLKEREKT